MIGNPANYQRFDEGPLLRADLPVGPRRDPTRFGRLGGWKARYRVADASATGVALSIESRVDLFADATGPGSDLQHLSDDATRAGARVATPTRSVGESAVALVSQVPAPRSIGYYTVAWRRGSMLASIIVTGFKDTVSIEEATALAEMVDRRIAQAGG